MWSVRKTSQRLLDPRFGCAPGMSFFLRTLPSRHCSPPFGRNDRAVRAGPPESTVPTIRFRQAEFRIPVLYRSEIIPRSIAERIVSIERSRSTVFPPHAQPPIAQVLRRDARSGNAGCADFSRFPWFPSLACEARMAQRGVQTVTPFAGPNVSIETRSAGLQMQRGGGAGLVTWRKLEPDNHPSSTNGSHTMRIRSIAANQRPSMHRAWPPLQWLGRDTCRIQWRSRRQERAVADGPSQEPQRFVASVQRIDPNFRSTSTTATEKGMRYPEDATGTAGNPIPRSPSTPTVRPGKQAP